MQQRIELPKLVDDSYEQLLWHWQWFREQLGILYPDLVFPEHFSRDAGEVRTQEPITEDDPFYDLTPAEFNCYARDQVIVFRQATATVTLEHHSTTFGTHFTLDFADTVRPQSRVHLLVSKRIHHYLDLDSRATEFAHWQTAAQQLTQRLAPGVEKSEG